MSNQREWGGNQRGIALVVSLLVLVFLSLLASALLVSINVETKIAGRTSRADRALNTAEAGIAEALERIRIGDVPDNNNPRMVAQIFLDQPGAVPSLGVDSVALPTYQDPATWLAYSTAAKGPDVLTVTYKTDANRNAIYKYDATKNPAIQTATGQPIYVVTSTGQVGDAKRTLVTEVFERGLTTNCKGAIAAGKQVHIVKDAWICGYNHRVDTPTWTDVTKGRSAAAGTCNEDLASQKWELGSGDLPGAWSGGQVNGTGNGAQYGSPTGYQQNQIGFYTGPWDLLGMTQAEFFEMTGPALPNPGSLSGDLNGLRYYKTSTLQVNGGDGKGLFYVDGNIQVNGDVTYRGLIYATGNIFMNGKTWVLGSIVSEKKLQINPPKKYAAILYSKDAITDGIRSFRGPFTTLSWREKP